MKLPRADDPIRIVAREHKERLLAFVRTACDEFAAESDMDARRAARLSRQWLILLDGAIAVALVSGEPDAALDAQQRPSLLDAEVSAKANSAVQPARTVAAIRRVSHPPQETATRYDLTEEPSWPTDRNPPAAAAVHTRNRHPESARRGRRLEHARPRARVARLHAGQRVAQPRRIRAGPRGDRRPAAPQVGAANSTTG